MSYAMSNHNGVKNFLKSHLVVCVYKPTFSLGFSSVTFNSRPYFTQPKYIFSIKCYFEKEFDPIVLNLGFKAPCNFFFFYFIPVQRTRKKRRATNITWPRIIEKPCNATTKQSVSLVTLNASELVYKGVVHFKLVRNENQSSLGKNIF